MASPLAPLATADAIRNDLLRRGWEASSAGQLAILYLIGKAKSISKGSWLWHHRPPFLPERSLKITARANMTFLRLLSEEIPCSFIAHSTNELAPLVPVA